MCTILPPCLILFINFTKITSTGEAEVALQSYDASEPLSRGLRVGAGSNRYALVQPRCISFIIAATASASFIPSSIHFLTRALPSSADRGVLTSLTSLASESRLLGLLGLLGRVYRPLP